MGQNGVQLPPFFIFEKSDQRFNEVATDFERSFSELCVPTGPFHPIVNSEMMVVAHYGVAWGNQLISVKLDTALKAEIHQWFSQNYGDEAWNEVNVYLAADIEVYVRDQVPEGWEAIGRTRHALWAVQTLPDGQVTYAGLLNAAADNHGAALPSWSPLDFVSPGRVAVILAGRYSARVAAQALRRGYRMLAGPTKELAQRLRTSIAARFAGRGGGMRTSSTGGTGGRPGGGAPGGGAPGGGAPGGGAPGGGVSRTLPGGTGPGGKIHGDHDIADAGALMRERAAAHDFARRPDVDNVFVGKRARTEFGVAEEGVPFPDVVAVKSDGTFLLAEGKGASMGKAIQQFESAHARLPTGSRITEHLAVVKPLKTTGANIDGKIVVRSIDGREWGVDAAGYLVRTAAQPWTRETVRGIPIRIVEYQ
jgi:hypothetical protein